jgi:microcompartment protein CcmL/EutN
MGSAPALALLEIDSVARGLAALDALVKKAEVEILEVNLVEPGRLLVLFAGGVAEVEESFGAGVSVGAELLLDAMLLCDAHAALLPALRGAVSLGSAEALDNLGVIEGSRVASVLLAAERVLKGARVSLTGLRVTGGLGGRAYFIVHGAQADVEAALELGASLLSARGHLHRVERIARPHPEMVTWLLRPPAFAPPAPQ